MTPKPPPLLPPLKPCPFCGGTNLELCNTHSPSFWVECRDCRGSAHGRPYNRKGNRSAYYSATPQHSESDYAHLPPEFRKAADSAIAAWNRRALPAGAPDTPPDNSLGESKKNQQNSGPEGGA